MSPTGAGFHDAISACSEWDGYSFDPGTHIRAANLLRERGQDEALDALREWWDSRDSEDAFADVTRLALLLRVAFVPRGHRPFPPIAAGQPMDEGEPRPGDFPLYPLALVQDVPLLIVPGVTLAGLPGDPRDDLAFCAEHCTLPSRPLQPPDDPMALPDELVASPVWYRDASLREHDLAMLRGQVARLIASGSAGAAP